MYRITNQRVAESIGYAFSILKPKHYELLKYTHFFTEDPIFCGLAPYHIWNNNNTTDNRSYRTTSHTLLLQNLPYDKHSTIVLLGTEHPSTVIHELGHILDELLQYQYTLEPNCSYAQTNRYEAFACAFEQSYYHSKVFSKELEYKHDSFFYNL